MRHHIRLAKVKPKPTFRVVWRWILAWILRAKRVKRPKIRVWSSGVHVRY